jgi:hypothetical protein
MEFLIIIVHLHMAVSCIMYHFTQDHCEEGQRGANVAVPIGKLVVVSAEGTFAHVFLGNHLQTLQPAVSTV